MNKLGSTYFMLEQSVNEEIARIYRFIYKHRYVILGTVILIAILNMFNPVFAEDLFDIALKSGKNVADKLTKVYATGVFPAVAVVCAVGIGFSKDPKKVEMFKTWLIRAVIALVLVVGYKLVIATINTITGGSISLPE